MDECADSVFITFRISEVRRELILVLFWPGDSLLNTLNDFIFMIFLIFLGRANAIDVNTILVFLSMLNIVDMCQA